MWELQKQNSSVMDFSTMVNLLGIEESVEKMINYWLAVNIDMFCIAISVWIWMQNKLSSALVQNFCCCFPFVSQMQTCLSYADNLCNLRNGWLTESWRLFFFLFCTVIEGPHKRKTFSMCIFCHKKMPSFDKWAGMLLSQMHLVTNRMFGWRDTYTII